LIGSEKYLKIRSCPVFSGQSIREYWYGFVLLKLLFDEEFVALNEKKLQQSKMTPYLRIRKGQSISSAIDFVFS
jgi:hypothetical protein